MLNGQRCVAVIQVRSGATRLPEKIFMKIGTQTLITHVINVVKRMTGIDEICIATTTDQSDDKIEKFCREQDVWCYRGEVNNVWSRFNEVSKLSHADWIIRICGDNPFLDVALANDLLAKVCEYPEYDYYSYRDNTTGNPAIKTHYGFFMEICSSVALQKIATLNPTDADLEHVTKILYERENIFSGYYLAIPESITQSGIRTTVDTPNDLAAVRDIVRLLGYHPKEYSEIVSLIKHNLYLKEMMDRSIEENSK